VVPAGAREEEADSGGGGSGASSLSGDDPTMGRRPEPPALRRAGQDQAGLGAPSATTSLMGSASLRTYALNHAPQPDLRRGRARTECILPCCRPGSQVGLRRGWSPTLDRWLVCGPGLLASAVAPCEVVCSFAVAHGNVFSFGSYGLLLSTRSRVQPSGLGPRFSRIQSRKFVHSSHSSHGDTAAAIVLVVHVGWIETAILHAFPLPPKRLFMRVSVRRVPPALLSCMITLKTSTRLCGPET
jgi:hypothetical protein